MVPHGDVRLVVQMHHPAHHAPHFRVSGTNLCRKKTVQGNKKFVQIYVVIFLLSIFVGFHGKNTRWHTKKKNGRFTWNPVANVSGIMPPLHSPARGLYGGSGSPVSHEMSVKKKNIFQSIHPVIIRCTSVTLIFLTPLLAFWTMSEIKTFCSLQSEERRLKCQKKKKVGQQCSSTETGAVQGWAMVNCTPLINQSTTASSCRAIVLPTNVLELDPTNGRYPSLNYPRSRIELALVLAIITQFWRIRCVGNR